MTDTTAVYAEITKAERDENGDLVVYGRATGPDLDLDRQICDGEWLKSAMPTWFQTGANVREQHSSIAAGVGTEITQKADGGWDLKALVVDANSARKVERGVLKGYSIGIRAPKVVKDAAAPGGRIVGGQIIEVSLVDRPANPTCSLTLAKALKPGPLSVTPGTVDFDRSLVKVEELHEDVEPIEELAEVEKADEPDVSPTAADVLDLIKSYDLVAVVKGDQARDIRDAEQAIAIVAGLIQSEAASLASDVDYEACDIALLLDAVRCLHYFKCREKKEPSMAHVTMSDESDATKSAAPDAATETAPVEEPETAPEPASVDTTKAAEGESTTTENNDDLTELVKALSAEVSELKGSLTKALNAPAPGGPVLTRTTTDTAKAEVREDHLAKAAHWERLAYEVTDPRTRAGYLQMASTEKAAATSEGA